ncbi:prophage side tail fiber protein homolog StfR-like [Ambystoma mexicanum]|uniref:prophage side tail fiber protein homolog StfR-like n=1 Tax=Ambystoma mexicanum TaxID=8296 RepID=UPI0037E93CEC
MNLAMATGGGSESPIKLQPWEEICASTIGMQSIEGVGGMERGAPTSGDAGSNSDLEEEDTTASTPTKRARPTVPTPQPSTSVVPRKTPQQAKSMQGKQDRAQTATPAGSTAAAAAADITPIMPTEATASAASSTIGETAAIAASSDSEAGIFEESDVRSPTGHPHSPYLSLSSPHADATQGQPEDDDWPATPSPLQGQISPMGIPLPLAMGQNSNHSLEAIATRQQQLSSLLEEHVAECGGSSAAMEKCAETVKAAIESSTKDICAELAAVRHAITDLVQTIRAMRPNEQAGSSSVASSTPSSPIRRSGRNLRNWEPSSRTTEYIKDRLYKPLDKEVRARLKAECPHPGIPDKVALTPELDSKMITFLGKNVKDPQKGIDRAWRACQDRVLDITGPLAKMMDLAEAALDTGEPIDPVILSGWAQRAICLLGNVCCAISAERRKGILYKIDTKLTELADTESGAAAQGLLFGDSFMKEIFKFVGTFTALDKAQASIRRVFSS